MNKDFEDKVQQVADAIGEVRPGMVVHVKVLHDEDCPALKTHCLLDCKCKPVIKKIVEY